VWITSQCSFKIAYHLVNLLKENQRVMIQFLEVVINLLQFTGRCVLSVVLYVY